MDLEAARKTLSQRKAFASKRIAFLVLAGLLVGAGLLVRFGEYFREGATTAPPTAVTSSPSPVQAIAPTPPVSPTSPPAPESASAPATAGTASKPAAQEGTNASAEPADTGPEDAAQSEPSEPSGSDAILISRRPVAVLASPSSSAPILYGLPAGRQFRMIGHDGSFAHIQDLNTSASGWVDEAALAQSPRAPIASAPSRSQPVAAGRAPVNASGGQKPKASATGNQVATGSAPPAESDDQRPGLFGRGGLFRGIFGNGN